MPRAAHRKHPRDNQCQDGSWPLTVDYGPQHGTVDETACATYSLLLAGMTADIDAALSNRTIAIGWLRRPLLRLLARGAPVSIDALAKATSDRPAARSTRSRSRRCWTSRCRSTHRVTPPADRWDHRHAGRTHRRRPSYGGGVHRATTCEPRRHPAEVDQLAARCDQQNRAYRALHWSPRAGS